MTAERLSVMPFDTIIPFLDPSTGVTMQASPGPSLWIPFSKN